MASGTLGNGRPARVHVITTLEGLGERVGVREGEFVVMPVA